MADFGGGRGNQGSRTAPLTWRDSVGQQARQGAVDRGVGLAEDACQLHRIDERHPAEEVEQPSV